MRILALFLTLTALALPASAQERPPSNCFALAQGTDAPRVIPASWGDEVQTDHVRIRYLGHASFAITSGGVMAVTDYTGWIGNPDVVPDVATMNNAHSTHWTANPDPRIPHLLPGWPDANGPAQYELDLGAMLVRNVTTDTRGPFGEGARADGNSIFVFEAGGLCIGHLGHLHQIPNDEQYAAIGRLDVVMVPVDGGYTLGIDDMAGIVKRLRASVVIPMHWFSGASLEVFKTRMEGEFDIVETGLAEMDFAPNELPGRPAILILDPTPIP
ncbi:MAG: Zn-dependent hydrolase [Rhodobacteraceae bacterium PARR1]|nr:MAG: Zn-dependent hydrolase [Rhodobacteraceae bacterium PARR1]